MLVCGYESYTILQVDMEGRWRLASLATRRDGVVEPWSISYSSTTSSIIVGGRWDNTALVFTV
ncbi:hypothetical protein DPMN_062080 [Dreissena polymorpha]|uniref:Uncharacterized protein n=1 Tax=Dreissena polymorpha TaxID=45954 RepID=A0A9D4C945_DREPO|nr:hypothetical protein DPMN_062080 [Dreissena polymorpha]